MIEPDERYEPSIMYIHEGYITRCETPAAGAAHLSCQLASVKCHPREGLGIGVFLEELGLELRYPPFIALCRETGEYY
jgi:hypothetical protein